MKQAKGRNVAIKERLRDCWQLSRQTSSKAREQIERLRGTKIAKSKQTKLRQVAPE